MRRQEMLDVSSFLKIQQEHFEGEEVSCVSFIHDNSPNAVM